jgi:hypothetical protein
MALPGQVGAMEIMVRAQVPVLGGLYSHCHSYIRAVGDLPSWHVGWANNHGQRTRAADAGHGTTRRAAGPAVPDAGACDSTTASGGDGNARDGHAGERAAPRVHTTALYSSPGDVV